LEPYIFLRFENDVSWYVLPITNSCSVTTACIVILLTIHSRHCAGRIWRSYIEATADPREEFAPLLIEAQSERVACHCPLSEPGALVTQSKARCRLSLTVPRRETNLKRFLRLRNRPISSWTQKCGRSSCGSMKSWIRYLVCE
jgi:hypothetical protein